MKHIKLFERFESKNISKIYSFIKKGKKQFISDLLLVCKENDIALSSVSDENFQKLKFSTAFRISDNDVKKFWFNSNGEYLGLSEIGNESIGSSYRGLDEILKNFSNLEKARIVWEHGVEDDGTIIIDMDESTFIVHNTHSKDGSTPTGVDWKKYGKYSWCLDGDDYDGVYKLYKDDSKTDPMIFNVPREKKLIKSLISDAEFCLVFNPIKIDNKLSTHLKKRLENRPIDLSDSEVRSKNLERYLKSLSTYNKDLGVKQLNSVLKRINGYRYPVALMSEIDIPNRFYQISNHFYEIIEGGDEECIKRCSDRVSNFYDESNKKMINIIKSVDMLTTVIKSKKQKEKLEFLNIFNELNQIYINWAFDREIKSLNDIDMICGKITAFQRTIYSPSYRRNRDLSSFIYYLVDFRCGKGGTSIDVLIDSMNADGIEEMKYIIEMIKPQGK